jgi:hypothetical protein
LWQKFDVKAEQSERERRKITEKGVGKYTKEERKFYLF